MNCDQIQVNTQSSIRVEGSKVVRFDPFKIGAELHDADVICITHAHYDHFDPDSIENVRKDDTVFIAPVSMAKELEKAAAKEQTHLLDIGEVLKLEGLTVTALPAYNKWKPFHPKRERWLGYLLEMDGIRYYIAGDTDAVKELQEVRCDVALVPVGGTYTMNAKEAAELVGRIGPAAAVPIHYGSIVGKPEDAETFRRLAGPGTEVITKL